MCRYFSVNISHFVTPKQKCVSAFVLVDMGTNQMHNYDKENNRVESEEL